MSFGAILLLAVGLAMDATAVSAARGVLVPRIQARQVLLVAGLFGGFQALMPLIGWVIGAELGGLVQRWDHWIVFVLLGAIGGKMLHEAWTGDAERAETGNRDVFALSALLVLAVATSIDALGAGFTLPLLDAPLAASLVTIGVTTALLSGGGLYLGRRCGAAIGRRLDVLGGLVLIGLGTKTLIEHLMAH